jgi:mannose-6-phosphate isomerase-like protein (cupin superfamily)
MTETHWTLESARQSLSSKPVAYGEIFRSATLSVGLYRLAAGSIDGQKPHNEDEVYYVVKGRASFRNGSEDRPIQPGDVLFVPRLVEHRFHDITETLELLVVFAPPETD